MRHSLARQLAVVLLTISTLLTASLPAAAAPAAEEFIFPPGFSVEAIAEELNLPTAFDIAADGRIFVAEKAGRVRVVQNGVLLEEPFIDLSHEVNDSETRGMMGLALHPNFPRTPFIYLSYVYEPPEAKGHPDSGGRVSRLVRVEADLTNTNVHKPGSFFVMLGKNSTFANIGNPDKADQPPFSCQDAAGTPVQDCLPAESSAHVIDFVKFGPDGALYVSNGDGTTNFKANQRAQDPNSLAGKILRINPLTGQGYANNPFFDGDYNSNRSKVYALGMRNPFRFTFSPYTGEIFVADVGNEDWEEINRGRMGANFGWPCFEGREKIRDHALCDPVHSGAYPATFAAYEYPHSQGYGAAIGGDFYTGSGYPARYRGGYFFHDFNVGAIQYLTFAANGAAAVHDFGGLTPAIVQISRGPGGDLLLLSLARGALYRLRYSAAAAAAAPTPAGGEGVEGEEVDSTTSTTTNSAPAGPLPAGQGSGNILREVWTGIGGTSVGDLTNADAFGGKPDRTELLPALESPQGDKDYGERISGYIYPPVTGQYRFWIASDDQSQLLLSTDASPANKRIIAAVPDWTPSREYDKYPDQASRPVTLRAGQRYYIEVLHKQADQKVNLSVAWQPPGSGRSVIDGAYLSPPE
ncbi:MAG: PQQ-dependent sugar dehydrogenase [Caldilineaceae bacterium]|nr:PQQ-dependent sugar dehydrogenase [Caldilineaceae bacterium]